MYYLLNTQKPENDYSTGKRIITAHFECDTVSDLPALVQSTYIARIGSTAHIIENNSLYAVKSNGVWVVQETGTDVYTKSQIDTMFAGKADTATTLAGYGITNAYTKTQTDTAIANATADKITMLNILGAGTRITATENARIDIHGLTNVGRYNWLSASAQYLDNCPITTGGIVVVEFIQSSNRIKQTITPVTHTNPVFYVSIMYSGTVDSEPTWTNWIKFEGVQV